MLKEKTQSHTSSQISEWCEESPSHHIATACPLGSLVSEIGSDHILHGDAHSLVHRNLDIAKAARLPTKSHGSESRSRGGVQAREFAATNRSRLKSIQRFNKKAMLSC